MMIVMENGLLSQYIKELEDKEELPKKDTPPVLKNSENTPPPRSPNLPGIYIQTRNK